VAHFVVEVAAAVTFCAMASNWHLRRSLRGHADSVKDAKERLAALLQKSSFVDVDTVNKMMQELPAMSLTNVMAAIRRCENTEQIMAAFLDVLKNERKRKETQAKVSTRPLDSCYN